jgi:hypothetical protein
MPLTFHAVHSRDFGKLLKIISLVACAPVINSKAISGGLIGLLTGMTARSVTGKGTGER